METCPSLPLRSLLNLFPFTLSLWPLVLESSTLRNNSERSLHTAHAPYDFVYFNKVIPQPPTYKVQPFQSPPRKQAHNIVHTKVEDIQYIPQWGHTVQTTMMVHITVGDIQYTQLGYAIYTKIGKMQYVLQWGI